MRISAANTLVLLALAPTIALAEPYQFEIDARYTEMDTASVIGAGGRYYYNVVDTRDHPLAEAAFLEKAGSVSVNTNRLIFDSDSPATQVTTITADYFFPDTKFYAAVFGRSRTSDGAPANFRSPVNTRNDLGITLGVVPIEGLLLTNSFSKDGRLFSPRAKYVRPLRGETALSIEAKSNFFSFDYYTDRTFSLGLTLSDRGNSTSTGIQARKFFTPQLSGQVAYTSDRSTDTWTLGLAYRF